MYYPQNYGVPGQQPYGVNPNINVYGQAQGYGYPTIGFGAGPKPKPKSTQPVTAEMSKFIFQQEDQLDMRISKTDSIKNSCTHKDPNTGDIALINNTDGSCTCRVCGETFHMIYDMTPDEIDKKVNDVIDIMQSAKTMYLDAPEDFIREFYQCLSLLKKINPIFQKSAKNFTKYEMFSGNMQGVYGQNFGNPNDPFAVVNNIMNANPSMYSYGQQAYGYGYPQYYNQPGYPYGQPAPQSGYGYPANPPAPPAAQPAPAPQPQAAPVDQGYRPQWMNGYIDPTTGASVPPVGNPYVTPVNPMENPLAFGAPAAPQAAPQAAPAPVTPPGAPAAPMANTEEIVQTKSIKV